MLIIVLIGCLPSFRVKKKKEIKFKKKGHNYKKIENYVKIVRCKVCASVSYYFFSLASAIKENCTIKMKLSAYRKET